MYVVTFYSYCGGVGRTTALVNAAIELAHRNRNVLVVDFDLQKPALADLDPFVPPEPHKGIIEYISEYLRHGRAPNVAEYIFRASHDLLPEDRGNVWVMPAGRDDTAYWRSLSRVDWNTLYDERDGFWLFENLRQQWQRGEGERLAPDYVLIDTHSGFSHQLDTCTCHLADSVVIIFTPDSAALYWEDHPELLLRVHEELMAERDNRLAQTGERTSSSMRNLAIHFVASKEPDWPDQPRINYESMNADIEHDRALIRVPFVPRFLVNRMALVRTMPQTRLAAAYRHLVDDIVRGNSAGDIDAARAFLKTVQDNPWMATDIDESSSYGIAPAQELDWIAESLASNSDVLPQLASCYFRAGRTNRAFETLDEALLIRPDDPDLLWQRASYNRRMNRREKAVQDLIRLVNLRFPNLPTSPTGVPETLLFDAVPPTYGEDPLIEDASNLDTYLVSALHALSELEPEQYENALSNLVARGLAPEVKKRLFSPRPPGWEWGRGDVGPLDLLTARQWIPALELLESRVIGVQNPKLDDVLYLLMARWGAGDEVKVEEDSRRAIDVFPQVKKTGGKEKPWKLGLLSVAYWKTGENKLAEDRLDHLEQQLVHYRNDRLFSFWRCSHVTKQQFLEDCVLQRKMIRGATILPPFLGREPGR